MDEAIRLAELLTFHHLTNKPEVHALLALMFFHYARSPAIINDTGNILLLNEQNRNLWDKKFIKKGIEHLELSSGGNSITEYHLEAGIAYFYITAESFEKTDWGKILYLYNILYKLNNSIIVGLNRAIVIAQLYGPLKGIEELDNIEGKELLFNNHLYYSVLGELHFQASNFNEAVKNFNKALQLSESEKEINLLNTKIAKVVTE